MFTQILTIDAKKHALFCTSSLHDQLKFRTFIENKGYGTVDQT